MLFRAVLVPVVERHDSLEELHRATLPEVEKLGAFEFLYLVSAEFEAAFEQALTLHEADPEHVRVSRFARPVREASALATGFDRARGRPEEQEALMQSVAKAKFQRISVRKARVILNMVRGQNVAEALDALRFTRKAAAPIVAKLIDSAIANAQQKEDSVDLDSLIVKEIGRAHV